jgi:hypothetical protein
MHSFQKNLPNHWLEWIRSFSLKQSDGKYQELSAGYFRGKVGLRFQDGSHAFFENAFFVKDEERQEIALFTEHCGYHVFNAQGVINAEHFEWVEPPFPFEG